MITNRIWCAQRLMFWVHPQVWMGPPVSHQERLWAHFLAIELKMKWLSLLYACKGRGMRVKERGWWKWRGWCMQGGKWIIITSHNQESEVMKDWWKGWHVINTYYACSKDSCCLLRQKGWNMDIPFRKKKRVNCKYNPYSINTGADTSSQFFY